MDYIFDILLKEDVYNGVKLKVREGEFIFKSDRPIKDWHDACIAYFKKYRPTNIFATYSSNVELFAKQRGYSFMNLNYTTPLTLTRGFDECGHRILVHPVLIYDYDSWRDFCKPFPLKDWLPKCENGEDGKVLKYGHWEVVERNSSTPFNEMKSHIFKHKNIYHWCVIKNPKNGKFKCVGFNQHPSLGWSFPVKNYNI